MMSRDEINAICDQLAIMIVRASQAHAIGQVRAAKDILRQGIRLARSLPVIPPPSGLH